MPHLLHLDSSAALGTSRSRQITATFAEAWRDRGPEYTVTYRDLHASPLPHLADAALHWPPRLRPAGGEGAGGTAGAGQAAFEAAQALQDQLISELLAADVLLVGAPMYNYSLPSALKAWIDHVHVPGRTAPFDEQTQPLAGRPAVVVSSSGASYDAGSPTEGWDHAIPVLQLILGTALGMSVEVIAASLTLAETVPALAAQLDRSRAELSAAHQEAAAAARRLSLCNGTAGRACRDRPAWRNRQTSNQWRDAKKRNRAYLVKSQIIRRSGKGFLKGFHTFRCGRMFALSRLAFNHQRACRRNHRDGRKDRHLKRSLLVTLSLLSLPLLAATALPASAVSNTSSTATGNSALNIDDPLCQSVKATCADVGAVSTGEYVGHDEPSLLFKSGVPGSGNDMTYAVTLPKDPKIQPNASGAGGSTWNFQLHPTFWFGLTLCDSQSAPEFTTNCTPDSDSNNLVGSNPNAPNYLGKHPGNAFMELQFYGPGYVPQFEGFGCTAKQYCAAMTIDSFVENQNTGVANTSACNNYILGGVEPINWAYVTRNGVSQAPANPLFTGTFTNPNLSAVNPNVNQDLLMNPGDRIQIHLHDTPAGFRVDMTDLSTGKRGSMTASIANGFGHILYTPTSSTCQVAPYAFHPEYSTANPRGTTWGAHTYNVAMSDEIGHFENCLAIDVNGNCTSAGAQDPSLDSDDSGCVPGTDSTVVKINGCFSSDEDFDGQSYRNDWPGTSPNPFADRLLHPTPVLFTSPLTHGRNYSTIAFETDLPRIEAADSQANPPFCDTSTGANCVNPPAGAQFYPFFSTTFRQGSCTWQEGGRYIPGTVNNFGGSSKAEFGPLLGTLYPEAGFTTTTKFDDFNSGNLSNPCRAA